MLEELNRELKEGLKRVRREIREVAESYREAIKWLKIKRMIKELVEREEGYWSKIVTRLKMRNEWRKRGKRKRNILLRSLKVKEGGKKRE